MYIIFSIVANPSDKNTEYIIASNFSLKYFSLIKFGINIIIFTNSSVNPATINDVYNTYLMPWSNNNLSNNLSNIIHIKLA